MSFWQGDGQHMHEWTTDFETYRRVCKVCGWIFKDMDTYLCQVCGPLPIESVIDVGTGLKGVVGSHFWRRKKHIKRGWAVDIWKLKPLVFWEPLKMNALDLGERFGSDSIDVVQAFGFLEHLTKKDGLKFLKIAEKIARRVVIVSAASELHGPTHDYKVKRDGNPYHYYWSTWQWDEFEELGYTSNKEDKRKGFTFKTEAFGWKVL